MTITLPITATNIAGLTALFKAVVLRFMIINCFQGWSLELIANERYTKDKEDVLYIKRKSLCVCMYVCMFTFYAETGPKINKQNTQSLFSSPRKCTEINKFNRK